MKQYTLSKNGSELGPYSLSEVIALITKREVELFDYIYDEGAQDWILLTEHPDITKALKAQKPKGPPKVSKPESEKVESSKEHKPIPAPSRSASPSSPHDVEWFILKGESQFGPFATSDLLRLMQEKTLFEFDFVWNSSMKDWQRLAEIPEFSKENIQALYKSPENKGSFFQRQHERKVFSGKVVVHDHNQYWLAEGKEISEGGMGLFIKDALIVPGQILNFHVKADGDRPAFNVKGEIVSKQFVGGARLRSERIEYGVKFLKAEKSAPSRKVG